MNDLISRSALLEHFQDRGMLLESIVRQLIEEAPAVDAVEVVRCRDCIKRDQSFRCIALYYGFNPHDDWFCAEGERDMDAEVRE